MISRKYETVVGTFVVASLIALLVMVIIIARQEGLFNEYVEYRATFKNVSGLKTGSEVHLAGVTVGNVTKIAISPDGSIVVAFQVLKQYSDRVRWDSQASIGFMGLLGEKSLDLTAGTQQQPPVPPEGFIAAVEPLDITQLLARAGPSLENLQKILDNLASITGGLVGKEGGLSKTMEEVGEIITKLNQGRGSLGLLVNDPKLYQETTQTVGSLKKLASDLEQSKGLLGAMLNDPKFRAQAEKAIADLQATVENIKTATTNLPEMVKNLEGFAKNLNRAGKGLPGLVTEGEGLMSDADKAAKAAQKTWLLRSHVPQPKERTIRMDAEPGKE